VGWVAGTVVGTVVGAAETPDELGWGSNAVTKTSPWSSVTRAWAMKRAPVLMTTMLQENVVPA
jgi:hypothetical protein